MPDTDGPYVDPIPDILPAASVESIKETYDGGPVASVDSIKASEPLRAEGGPITLPPPSVDIEKKGIERDDISFG